MSSPFTIGPSETKIKGVGFNASEADAYYRTLPYGTLPVADWKQGLVMRGMAYHYSIGSFSTPVAGGGASAVIDLDRPRGLISVPSGFTLIPLRIHVQAQTPLLATDSDESEILIAVDRAAAWYQDGANTAGLAYNMRTDLGAGGPVQCASVFTGDMTYDGTNDPVLSLELAHSVIIGDVQGTAATALWTKHELLYEPAAPPLIVGPAALYIYWGGTVATTGFAQAEFAVVPSAVLKALAV